MTRLVLVRHGQTVANVEGRWTGWGATELTELGREQVGAVARRLAEELDDAVALYTSPLPRARETAVAIGRELALEPIPMEGLREINFGDLDGVSLKEMEEQHPELYAQWRNKTDTSFTWPGGERRSDFFLRVAQTCEEVISRHEHGAVVIVGHGGTLRSCLAHLLPASLSEWWKYSLDNCGLTVVEIGLGSERRLLVLNDTSHLPEGS